PSRAQIPSGLDVRCQIPIGAEAQQRPAIMHSRDLKPLSRDRARLDPACRDVRCIARDGHLALGDDLVEWKGQRVGDRAEGSGERGATMSLYASRVEMRRVTAETDE